uniref:Glutaredoxin-1 n=1 Tax=Anthurium amnicola TaxID=1678845 RepID=A0A1D1ZL30_9ARAE
MSAISQKSQESKTVGEYVEKLIQENPIMIFSKSYCPYCKKAKGIFETLNVKYKAIELDNNPDQFDGKDIQNYLKIKTKQGTVPNIFINSEHIGGSDDLSDANENGTLKEKLANPKKNSESQSTDI